MSWSRSARPRRCSLPLPQNTNKYKLEDLTRDIDRAVSKGEVTPAHQNMVANAKTFICFKMTGI